MDKEELIYDGYVKIYDVTKNNNGKIEKFTKVHLRGASAGIVINEEGKIISISLCNVLKFINKNFLPH